MLLLTPTSTNVTQKTEYNKIAFKEMGNYENLRGIALLNEAIPLRLLTNERKLILLFLHYQAHSQFCAYRAFPYCREQVLDICEDQTQRVSQQILYE